jgi:hypothetical protein
MDSRRSRRLDDLGVRDEVPHELEEVVARPRAGEREPVRHLVQRHPRPELHPRQVPFALELGDVRDHERQAARGPGDGQVVLAEHPLAQAPEDGAGLHAHEQRPDHLQHLARHLAAASGFLAGKRAGHAGKPRESLSGLQVAQRGGQAGGHGLDDFAQRGDARLDPLARRTASTRATSGGLGSAVRSATASSAARTVCSSEERSSSPGTGSSAPHDADAMPT